MRISLGRWLVGGTIAATALISLGMSGNEAAVASDEQRCDSGWALEAISVGGGGVSSRPEETVRVYLSGAGPREWLDHLDVDIRGTEPGGLLALVRRRGVVKGSFDLGNDGSLWRVTRERSCSELYP